MTCLTMTWNNVVKSEKCRVIVIGPKAFTFIIILCSKQIHVVKNVCFYFFLSDKSLDI